MRGCAKYLNRSVSLLLVSLLVFGQWSEIHAGQTVKKLNLVIIEGDGAINNIRQRVAREVIVQVNDENDRPVGAGALVAFLLPRSGAGGSFANGANTFSVATDSAGRAAAGFTPNTIAGSYQVNVTATFQGQTATTVIEQSNGSQGSGGSTNPTGPIVPVRSRGISGRTIALMGVAAVAALTVGLVVNKKEAETAPTQAPTIRIGVGGPPVAGAPGSFVQSNLKDRQ
jgi:hypothetical protein